MDEKDIIIMAYEKNPYGLNDERRAAFAEGFFTATDLLQGLAWHNVSEELPKMAHFTTDGDYSDSCVCINEHGEHKMLVLCENRDYTYWAYAYDGEDLYDEETEGKITHWMYIPEKTKEG